MDNAELHPTRRELLLHIDGELATADAERIRTHLEACWSCRLSSEQLQSAILSVADFCDSVLTPAAGEPPRGWHGFDEKLQATVDAAGRESLRARIQRSLLSWRALTGVAAGVLLCLLAYRLTRPPAVSAMEFLGRAEQSRSLQLRVVRKPVVYQKVRIREGSASVTREIWRDALDNRVHDTWGAPADAQKNLAQAFLDTTAQKNLSQILSLNHLQWNDPLSPAAYMQWRASAGAAKDEVTHTVPGEWTVQTRVRNESADDQKTDHPEPRIVAASLTVRAHDFHPLAERLEIEFGSGANRSQREVEFSELDYAVIPSDALSQVNPPVEIASRPSAPTVPAHTVPAPPVLGPSPIELADDEMAARYALHRVGADLGDQIEIQLINSDPARSAPPNTVVVRGVVDSKERRDQLLSAVGEVPNTKTDVHTPDEITLSPSDAAPLAEPKITQTEILSSRSPVEKQLLDHCGSKENAEVFTRRAFAITESLTAEAWALKHLDDRYPGADRPQLSASSRQLLEQMLRDHDEALRRDAAELATLLKPLLQPIASANSVSKVDSGDASMGSTPVVSVLEASRQIEAQTIELLSGSVAEKEDEPQDIAIRARGLLRLIENFQIRLGENSK